MAAFALDAFERQAEAFSRAHSWREYQFEAGVRPGRGLRTLYDDDFRALASTDLFLDLQAASDAQPAQLRRLTHLLACANLEANTRDFAARAGGL